MAVAYHAPRSVEEVRDDLWRIVDALRARIRMRNDAAMVAAGAIPWSPDRALWQAIGGETFLHWPGHSEALEAAAQA
jgi:hypothetical protein